MKVDRRELLRHAGLASLAAGSLPTFFGSLAQPAWAQGRTNYTFLCLNRAGPAGTPQRPAHMIGMGGQGTFDPSRPGSQATGAGVFTHFTSQGAFPSPGAPPLPIVASGTWKASRLVSYKQLGTYGVFAAGIAEILIDLFRQVPAPATIRGARLRIVCNVFPAGLVHPGEIEGYTLSIPGTDFFTGGTPGPFTPIPPAGFGLTVFSVVPIP